jgi:type II secretory pathway pseudopilin PulG
MKNQTTPPFKTTGFTIIEIAIVLFIIGIITASLLSGAGAFRETAKFKEDQQKLQDIKLALLSYSAVNAYLPCPDTDGNGKENRTAAHCTNTTGLLPHLDLNTHATNAYGYPFSYHVNRHTDDPADIVDENNSASYFGNCSGKPCFNMRTPPRAGQGDDALGNYRVSDGTNPLANQVPLVVISHGKDLKNLTTCNGNGNFENWNCDLSQTADNQVLLYQAQQGDNFDDVIIWLTSLEIKKITPGILDNIQQNNNNNNSNNNLTEQLLSSTPITLPDMNNIVFDSTVNVKITGDTTTTAEIDKDQEVLYITGDANHEITTTADNKIATIVIDGDLNNALNLSQGGGSTYTVHIKGNVNANILSDKATNELIIEKNVSAGAVIELSNNKDNTVFIGGYIFGSISGKGSIYINKTSAEYTSSDMHPKISGFTTRKCRQSMENTTWVDCPSS